MELFDRKTLYESFSKIKKLMRNWEFSSDNSIDVSKSELTSLEDLHLPEVLEGSFWCFSNNLKSLKGSPKIVGKDFNCIQNKLKTLEGGPTSVERDYYCNKCELNSLQGAPEHVGGDFWCELNPDLTEEELLKYKATKAVRGKIISNKGVI